MNTNSRQAVRQVLQEAAQQKHFIDLSDAERLAWMIERGYTLGQQHSRPTCTVCQRKMPTVPRRKDTHTAAKLIVDDVVEHDVLK